MLKVLITTPQRQLFEGPAESVTLPGTVGSFTVLDHHAPIMSTLEGGSIVVKGESKVMEFPLQSGFVEVKDNMVSICME